MLLIFKIKLILECTVLLRDLSFFICIILEIIIGELCLLEKIFFWGDVITLMSFLYQRTLMWLHDLKFLVFMVNLQVRYVQIVLFCSKIVVICLLSLRFYFTLKRTYIIRRLLFLNLLKCFTLKLLFSWNSCC